MLCVTYCFLGDDLNLKKVTIKCPNQAYFRLFKATIAFSEKMLFGCKIAYYCFEYLILL